MLNMLHTLAAYNTWANAVLLEDLADLSPAILNERHSVDFSSIIGILNHLLSGDRLWLHRFTGAPPEPESIAEIIAADLDSFRELRVAEDVRIATFVKSLGPTDLEGELHYKSIAGVPQRKLRRVALLQMFNHQTHHRAEVRSLAQAEGSVMRDIDLVFFPGSAPQMG